MRRNRLRLAYCFQEIGLVRSLGACLQRGVGRGRGGGARSPKSCAPFRKPARYARATAQRGAWIFARQQIIGRDRSVGRAQTEDLKVPGSIPGLGI